MKTGLTQVVIAVPDDAVAGLQAFATRWWNESPQNMGPAEASKWYQISRKKGWGNLAIPIGALVVDVLVKGGWVDESVEPSEGEVAEDEHHDDAADPVSPEL